MQSGTVDALIDAGFAHHQAGRLEEAESAYRDALARAPDNPDARHLFGLILHQTGRHDEAVESLRAAVALDPSAAEFHHNLAEALRASNQLDEAIASYKKALELDLNAVDSQRCLGICHQLQGDFSDAIECWNRSLELSPDHPETLNNIGVAYRHLAKPELAIPAFQKALELKPDYLDCAKNLSRAFLDKADTDNAIDVTSKFASAHPESAEAQVAHAITLNTAGRYAEAMQVCRTALRLNPDLAEAHFNLGLAFDGIGEYHGAVLAYARTGELEPERFAPQVNLGLALMAVGEIDRAAEALSTGAKIRPDSVGVLFNLAVAYERAGRFEKAIETAHRVLEIRPNWPLALALVGTLHLRVGRHAVAEEWLLRAVDGDPPLPQAWNNLASLYAERGEHDRCFDAMRKALELRPDARTHDVLLFYMNSDERFTPQEVFEAHVEWNQKLQDKPATPPPPYLNSPDPDRRIRIGYVSPDFRMHSVSFFISAILARHNRQQVEVYCYDDSSKPDSVTSQLQRFSNRWRRIVGMATDQVEAMIREDQIDILVDLAGHTADNRLLVFARKPAPVQVTYLGYPNTTGLKTIDYRMTDAIADPEGLADSLHTEKLVRLPKTFLCYSPAPEAPPVADLPALTAGHVTFASFNALTKVTPQVIALWSRVIKAVPGSKLILKGKGLAEESTRSLFLKRFEDNGIGAERLIFINKILSFTDHLAAYGKCDIGLDPYPYHGTTTTCEALWMGVPVVTLAGQTHVSRVGASLLTNIGLPKLIAKSPDEYVEIAAALAGDLVKLSSLRSGMRKRVAASPLFDGATFTANLETAYRQMWQTWCAAQK
jgi:predicted O-linked N-acetylglucosamine transferase (SPINDLY family)